MNKSRRDFIKCSAAGALASLPLGWAATASADGPDEKRTVAAIGVGGSRAAYSQGRFIAHKAAKLGRMIAVCDVDVVHSSEFNASFGNKLAMYGDYRKLLEREKPEIVTIGTPDHWHVPIAIAAMRAGCDVYCEKPLTLTIQEGIQIRQVVKETGKVFQVGTQQRSEDESRFLKAIAIVQSGRLGKRVNTHVAIGDAPVGGPFATAEPPAGLNWDMWQGPANAADYSAERRKDFRWYYDYSGGKMTDWGAHHIDIAQWAMGHDHTGPVRVSATGKFTPLVPEKFDWIAYLEGRATLPNGYHTASQFAITHEYADGSVMTVHDHYRSADGKTDFPNGILFEGEEGRIFVNRERLTGKPIEELTKKDQADLDEAVVKLYGGKQPGNHMKNFFDCVASRGTPISDVDTHHRTMTCCHLGNIALMLGRELKWDPDKEQFVGDEQATALMSRPRRKKYSWKATT
ncbi:MAG: Gfo/Idh/MocA family oxidoreductase [Pirellulales bacterium]|nr:Gfo/Idh/MocA family oxidoreductase [Pirellulales bacterium]